MGIQLSSLISGKEISVGDLKGKVVAVDAFNWLYQFLSIIRGSDGNPLQDSQGRVTSHLSGLFYRSINLIEAGAKLVYVFDGEPPHFKFAESERRRELRKEAREKWQEAVDKGDAEEALKFAKRTATLTNEMVEDSKKLLNAMGVCVVQAPGEGEALAAQMVAANDAWCVATQDFDSLLFGASRLVRNLSISGRRRYMKTEYVMVNPELILLKDVLHELDITRDQLIILGILIGTDYNPGGIHGYGPKKALKIVKEKKKIEDVLKETGWKFDVPAEEIFDFFKSGGESSKNSQIVKSASRFSYDIKFPKMNEEEVKKILCDEHEFSNERAENGIRRLKGETKGKRKTDKLVKSASQISYDKEQSSLSKWVKK